MTHDQSDLIKKAQELQNIGDYGGFDSVTAEKAQEVIEQAESFYSFATKT